MMRVAIVGTAELPPPLAWDEPEPSFDGKLAWEEPEPAFGGKGSKSGEGGNKSKGNGKGQCKDQYRPSAADP